MGGGRAGGSPAPPHRGERMSAPSVLLAGQDPHSARNAARLSRYKQYLDFYAGAQWEKRPLPGERRLTSNYARALVKKAVFYLFPDPVTFSVVGEGRQSARAEARAAAA